MPDAATLAIVFAVFVALAGVHDQLPDSRRHQA